VARPSEPTKARGSFSNPGAGDGSLARLHLTSVRPARPTLGRNLAGRRVPHLLGVRARDRSPLSAAYNDLVSKGPDEEGQGPGFWVRRHDEYDVARPTFYDRSRGRVRSARLRRPSAARDAAVRARAARPRAQRPGLRRVDVVGGAHPHDARVAGQQLAAGDDAGREPRRSAAPCRRLPQPDGGSRTRCAPHHERARFIVAISQIRA
jgi:hypothetical protein